MPRDGNGVFSLVSNTDAVSAATIESAKYNSRFDDVENDLNAARPVGAGGTGATSASGARTNLELGGAWKLDATAAPDANDDGANTGSNGTFAVGSIWIDVTNDNAYVCVDATTSNAVWVQTGGGDVVSDTTPQLGGDLDANGNDILFDNATGINDDSDNKQLVFNKTASAVNHLDVTNAATGNAPALAAAGDDTDIDLSIAGKGAGTVDITSPDFVLGSDADGDLYYRASGQLARLAKGTAGQALLMNSGATAPEWAGGVGWTYPSTQALTSGSTKDFTSIPSGVTEIELYVSAQNVTGTARNGLIQLGDSGGLETTGYGGSAVFTSGFHVTDNQDNGEIVYATVRLIRFSSDGTVWGHMSVNDGDTGDEPRTGVKTLSAELDRVRYLLDGGAFAAGTVGMRYR